LKGKAILVAFLSFCLSILNDSSGKSIQTIAGDNDCSSEQLREWRGQGTRLVALSAAGDRLLFLKKNCYVDSALASFYIVVIIAVLGLKSAIIYRHNNNYTNITFLANVLRNPGSKSYFITAT
jgi:hypothetical protein